MDLCSSASLEFAVIPKAGCVPAVMQQGKIDESAGVVFWREKRCVTIAGRHWGLSSILEQVCRLSHTAAVACRGSTCKLGTRGNQASTSTL